MRSDNYLFIDVFLQFVSNLENLRELESQCEQPFVKKYDIMLHLPFYGASSVMLCFDTI